jgi:hypothetical protein
LQLATNFHRALPKVVPELYLHRYISERNRNIRKALPEMQESGRQQSLQELRRQYSQRASHVAPMTHHRGGKPL